MTVASAGPGQEGHTEHTAHKQTSCQAPVVAAGQGAWMQTFPRVCAAGLLTSWGKPPPQPLVAPRALRAVPSAPLRPLPEGPQGLKLRSGALRGMGFTLRRCRSPSFPRDGQRRWWDHTITPHGGMAGRRDGWREEGTGCSQGTRQPSHTPGGHP